MCTWYRGGGEGAAPETTAFDRKTAEGTNSYELSWTVTEMSTKYMPLTRPILMHSWIRGSRKLDFDRR